MNDIVQLSRSNVYDRLFAIYIKHCRSFNNKDSKQMCCMWSIDDPPDEIYYCDQIYDIQEEFDVSLTEDDALDLYDMYFEDAVDFVIRKIENKE